MVVGGAAATILTLSTPLLYVASASFIPDGNESPGSGLASIAGQFGVALPSANQSQTPAFYVSLLTSRVLLRNIARDTFDVQEMGDSRVAVLDLLQIPQGTEASREEQGIRVLTGMVTSRAVPSTGEVVVTAGTQWPSVSLAIVTRLVDGVNAYNQRTKKGQAVTERKFIEGRLDVARTELRATEDLLQEFVTKNRQLGNSPELTFQRDRMQRDVTLRQQVFATLMQSYEDARIREVRDTPSIRVFEPPSVPTAPKSRGRLLKISLGVTLGAFIGVLMAVLSEFMHRRRVEQNIETDKFLAALNQAKRDARLPLEWLRTRFGR